MKKTFITLAIAGSVAVAVAAEADKKEIAPKTIKFEKKIKTGSSDRLVDNIVK